MKLNRSICILLVILCLLTCIFTVPDYTCAEEKETIKVGYAERNGYHTTDKRGNYQGYDYEYLTEIADYTDWEYEFVEGTWQECLERLKRGEIDILGGVSKTDEREDFALFSDSPSMYVSYCLMQKNGDKKYDYEDFDAFDGMTVGVIKSSSAAQELLRYSRENHFTCRIEYYDAEDSLIDSLDKGEVDCICLTDNRDLSHYSVMARFGYTQLYYAVAMNRPDLQAGLNNAMNHILAKNHYYEGFLSKKYYTSVENIALMEK